MYSAENTMDQQRQQAFEKLRPSCVRLSSVALKFEGHQAAVKEVLRALEEQSEILHDLGSQHQLDEKLASYAIWPLTKIFNQSQGLSSRCLQVAIESVNVLVTHGWRQRLELGMGKQLLILMSLLSGSDPRRQGSAPDDELKSFAFKCMKTLIYWLSQSPAGKSTFQDQNARNIVDQLAYLLVENLTDTESDIVQTMAGEALLELINSIRNRVFLASLLPRLVSSLTRALRPSTKARRTRKVLFTDLQLLKIILQKVLADSTVASGKDIPAEQEALNESWLKATAAQVTTALTQVMKLRSHTQLVVRQALFNLCVMVVEDCNDTLKESVPIAVETLVVLASNADDETAAPKLKYLMISRPEMTEMLQSNFYDWTQSLPRIMQGNDDKPKEIMLTRITSSFKLLSQTLPNIGNLASVLTSSILRSITNQIQANHMKPLQIQASEPDQYSLILRRESHQMIKFEKVLFNHQSEQESMQVLNSLIDELRELPAVGTTIRVLVEGISEATDDQKLPLIWLSLQLLDEDAVSTFDLDDVLDMSDSVSGPDTSRAYLIHDLYVQTKAILLDSCPHSESPTDPQLVALALESLVLQAKQLSRSYRSELYETLYPVLALLSSRDRSLKNHAITTLNIVASSCQYASVSALLIENVDYLVNSIGWKLNTFSLSPEAPAVLNMVVRLVGSKLIPYLDDLIASIFTALDSFHGYTQWVEILFEVLRTIIDESVQMPDAAITDDGEQSQHTRASYIISTIDNIVNDLRARKKRRLASSSRMIGLETSESAPNRPWTKVEGDPNHKPDPTEGKDIETLLREADVADAENELPAPNESEADKEEDLTKPRSKTHDLLLRIAQSTVPHLSSPSPRVRRVLLQILAQITPLLARHENTFLPLVNFIWPGVIQRLFAPTSFNSLSSESKSALTTSQSRHADEATDDMDTDLELPYNVATAANVVSLLCEYAGDFMSSRIEQIWSQLKVMYAKSWKGVEEQIHARQRKEDDMKTNRPENRIIGVVDLQVAKNDDSATTTTKNTSNSIFSSSSSTYHQHRTTQSQTLISLVNLYLSIITHVQINESHVDDIFELLKPLLLEFADLDTSSGHRGHGARSNSDANATSSSTDGGWRGLANKTLDRLTEFDPDRVWVLKMEGI